MEKMLRRYGNLSLFQGLLAPSGLSIYDLTMFRSCHDM